MNCEALKKRCMARYIYSNKLADQLTPKGAREAARNTKAKSYTWADWWRDKYGDEFWVYVNAEIDKRSRAA